MFTANLGSYQGAVEAALDEITEENIVERIWAHDHTVWEPDPTEITNRLGWLHSPQTMEEHIGRLEKLTDAVREYLAEKGYDRVYGARPLKRAIQQYIENPLAMEILKGAIAEGTALEAVAEGDQIRFKTAAGNN